MRSRSRCQHAYNRLGIVLGWQVGLTVAINIVVHPPLSIFQTWLWSLGTKFCKIEGINTIFMSSILFSYNVCKFWTCNKQMPKFDWDQICGSKLDCPRAKIIKIEGSISFLEVLKNITQCSISVNFKEIKKSSILSIWQVWLFF